MPINEHEGIDYASLSFDRWSFSWPDEKNGITSYVLVENDSDLVHGLLFVCFYCLASGVSINIMKFFHQYHLSLIKHFPCVIGFQDM